MVIGVHWVLTVLIASASFETFKLLLTERQKKSFANIFAFGKIVLGYIKTEKESIKMFLFFNVNACYLILKKSF